jgi:hypothetical protein
VTGDLIIVSLIFARSITLNNSYSWDRISAAFQTDLSYLSNVFLRSHLPVLQVASDGDLIYEVPSGYLAVVFSIFL